VSEGESCFVVQWRMLSSNVFVTPKVFTAATTSPVLYADQQAKK